MFTRGWYFNPSTWPGSHALLSQGPKKAHQNESAGPGDGLQHRPVEGGKQAQDSVRAQHPDVLQDPRMAEIGEGFVNLHPSSSQVRGVGMFALVTPASLTHCSADS